MVHEFEETGHVIGCNWRRNPNASLGTEPQPGCRKKVQNADGIGKHLCGVPIAKHVCLGTDFKGLCSRHYKKSCDKNAWSNHLSPCANIKLDESDPVIDKPERLVINQFDCEDYGIPNDEDYNHISTSMRKEAEENAAFSDSSEDQEDDNDDNDDNDNNDNNSSGDENESLRSENNENNQDDDEYREIIDLTQVNENNNNNNTRVESPAKSLVQSLTQSLGQSLAQYLSRQHYVSIPTVDSLRDEDNHGIKRKSNFIPDIKSKKAKKSIFDFSEDSDDSENDEDREFINETIEYANNTDSDDDDVNNLCCSKCGKHKKRNDIFCSKCGMKLIV